MEIASKSSQSFENMAHHDTLASGAKSSFMNSQLFEGEGFLACVSGYHCFAEFVPDEDQLTMADTPLSLAEPSGALLLSQLLLDKTFLAAS